MIKSENAPRIGQNIFATADICRDHVVDLGQELDARFTGIFSPSAHLNANLNASQVYDFDKAHLYHQRHYYPAGIQLLLERALERYRLKDKPLALDIGSGSGNSVSAMLRSIDGVNIVATDVSPDLLAIMKKNMVEEGLPADHLNLLCLDVHEPYFKDNSFDIICGSAILHHLVDPRRAVVNAMHALRPGGAAFFFEPFEYGCAILKLVHSRLLQESDLRARLGADPEEILKPEVAQFLRDFSHHLTLREGISGGIRPETLELDDKWLFTREFFEGIREEVGASKLIIYSNHMDRLDNLFGSYMYQNLHLAYGWGADSLPAWAWQTIREVDDDISDEMKMEFMIEGTIIIIK